MLPVFRARFALPALCLLLDCTGVLAWSSEARADPPARNFALIAGGGVYLDGRTVADGNEAPAPPQILQVGKRRFARLVKP